MTTISRKNSGSTPCQSTEGAITVGSIEHTMQRKMDEPRSSTKTKLDSESLSFAVAEVTTQNSRWVVKEGQGRREAAAGATGARAAATDASETTGTEGVPWVTSRQAEDAQVLADPPAEDAQKRPSFLPDTYVSVCEGIGLTVRRSGVKGAGDGAFASHDTPEGSVFTISGDVVTAEQVREAAGYAHALDPDKEAVVRDDRGQLIVVRIATNSTGSTVMLPCGKTVGVRRGGMYFVIPSHHPVMKINDGACTPEYLECLERNQIKRARQTYLNNVRTATVQFLPYLRLEDGQYTACGMMLHYYKRVDRHDEVFTTYGFAYWERSPRSDVSDVPHGWHCTHIVDASGRTRQMFCEDATGRLVDRVSRILRGKK